MATIVGVKTMVGELHSCRGVAARVGLMKVDVEGVSTIFTVATTVVYLRPTPILNDLQPMVVSMFDWFLFKPPPRTA